MFDEAGDGAQNRFPDRRLRGHTPEKDAATQSNARQKRAMLNSPAPETRNHCAHKAILQGRPANE
jgi:hypothetical protein